MAIETSASPRIVWMLHEKAVQIIHQARITEDRIKQRELITIVQNILAQLEYSLKVTDQLSQGLFYLYDYCYSLLESDVTQKHAIAATILATLRDTFGELLRQ